MNPKMMKFFPCYFLLAALKERGQLENTLILFLSDNGGNAESGIKGNYTGDHPGDAHSNVFIGQCWAHLNNTLFRKYKLYNHEGGTASPLIAHWPAGIKPQEGWVTTSAHVIDIMATCVDLGVAKYPEHVPPMEGKSLRPLFEAGGKFDERSLFFEHEGNAAVRAGDLKLVRAGRGGTWELYDLKADCTEQNDLAKERPEKVEELSAMWKHWARRIRCCPIRGRRKIGKEK